MDLNTITLDDIIPYIMENNSTQKRANYKKVNQVLENMKNKPKVFNVNEIKINKNWLGYYDQHIDEIVILNPRKFKSKAFYFHVLLHELAHATGHERRLKRKSLYHQTEKTRQKEELTACITSVLICMKTGILHKISLETKTKMCSHIDAVKGLNWTVNQIDISFKNAIQATKYILGEQNEINI